MNRDLLTTEKKACISKIFDMELGLYKKAKEMDSNSFLHLNVLKASWPTSISSN